MYCWCTFHLLDKIRKLLHCSWTFGYKSINLATGSYSKTESYSVIMRLNKKKDHKLIFKKQTVQFKNGRETWIDAPMKGLYKLSTDILIAAYSHGSSGNTNKSHNDKSLHTHHRMSTIEKYYHTKVFMSSTQWNSNELPKEI